MANKKKIVIIGGVAGGASAAARARRLSEDAEIVMFERGQYISFANCGLPYHIGGVIQDRGRLLVQTPETMKSRFRIDVRIKSEVTSIDREKKTVTVKDLESGKEYTESYDNLVLSPGADPFRPPIPGADNPRVFTLRNMADMDAIIAKIELDKPKKAVVVGAGYIGLEMTESLRERGLEVVVVELAPQVMVTADPEMTASLKQQLQLNGVDLRLNRSITAFSDDGKELSAHLSSGEIVKCGIALLNVGVRPESKLAKDAGIETGERGGIVTDGHMRTNDPFIYAVGDAVEVNDFIGGFKTLIPLAGPANRQGRIAADNIFGRPSVYKDTQGTAICKVFDQAIAMTGLSEKNLKRAGMSYEKIYVHPASHATYYPGASPISLKLMFDPNDGRILGAQAVGSDGVDKRIDVLAVAIRAGMTVYDLENLELTYAPPFGSAKDAVNYAGFVASNVMRGDAQVCHYEDVNNPRENQLLLDVRSPFEVEAGTIPGARNIPIDNLRDRLAELPKNKEILVFCQVGLRGYLACRILTQNGFKARNLTGGYKTFTAFRDSAPYGEKEPPKPQTPQEKESCIDTGETGIICKTIPSAGGGLPEVVKNIDATGLQCPGPIMRLKLEMDDVFPGKAVSISVTDPGFVHDIPAWCNSTGNELLDVRTDKGIYTALIIKRDGKPSPVGAASMAKHKTIVVFSADLDKVMAAFIIANGAASMGSEVSLFFTFWGLNALRRTDSPPVNKTFMESMFGFMMPKGASKLGLSRMNYAGMGKRMMVDIMNKKNVASVPDLIQSAMNSGIKLIACSMTMDVMGIHAEELIDGVEIGGVAMYLDKAEAGNVNLFVG